MAGPTPRGAKLSSQFTTIELIRTCRRLDDEDVSGARQLLAGVDLVPLSEDLLEAAALNRPLELRSLDAIHLATALSVADQLSAFVVYDSRVTATRAWPEVLHDGHSSLRDPRYR
jgi:uncharacterized protein